MKRLLITRRSAVALLVASSVCGGAFAQPPAQPNTERLLKVARLWVTVEYFHPYLATRDIEWSRALADAYPAIRDAHSSGEYLMAVNKLLSALNDQQTTAGLESSMPVHSTPASAQQFRFHHGLTPEDGSPSPFYSAILVRAQTKESNVTIDLGEGVVASVRLSEPAKELTAKRNPQEPWISDEYPSEGWRYASAARIWGAVRYFFAYKDVMGEDWDRVFADYLPKIVSAKDARGYHLTIAELISHLSDSNATAESTVLASYWGEARPEITIRLVEKKPVVTRVSEDALKAGLKVGDVITSVDGENVIELIKKRANYLSASTPASLSEMVAQKLLDGAADSTVKLRVTDSAEPGREFALQRIKNRPEAPSEAPVRMLANGIGYVDARRLEPDGVAAAFEKTASSKGLIFDLRGECNLDPNALAARLTHEPRQALLITGPVAEAPDLAQPEIESATGSYFFVKRVAPNAGTPYAGKVALLIDARTRGRAEQAALYIAAASKAQIFGTPSAGAPSETTNVRLPGGILVRFSGEDIRLTNGGAIQREGLQPTEVVPITLPGIRAGKDEVLEQALKSLREEAASMVD